MRWQKLFTALAVCSLVAAHTVITYPGWRGNNLLTNGTAPQLTGSDGVVFDSNGTVSFPYGMQFIFPCGGLPVTTNRTKWPFQGGAVSVQPGWDNGHSKAQMYINIGINPAGSPAPPNMSHNVVPPFEIFGPTDLEYPGQFCLPQVPMPANVSLGVGDNITIQVVELTQFGAALYSCVDVTLAEPQDVEQVNANNCYNSTDLSFGVVFSTASLSSGATSVPGAVPNLWTLLSIMLMAAIFTFF